VDYTSRQVSFKGVDAMAPEIDIPVQFYEVLLTCVCGNRLYAMLKEGESIPCSKCGSPLTFSVPSSEDILDAEVIE
jgi:hypothetical protein